MIRTRVIPQFACPFLTANEALEETSHYLELDAKKQISDAECLNAGNMLKQGNSHRENLRLVYRWKLESFRNRFWWVDEFPDGVTDEQIFHALSPARHLSEKSSNSDLRFAINVLTCLPRVGIPVASAVLMAMHPRAFTVTDRQAYNALSVDFREPMHPDEYIVYVKFCRTRADRLGITLRQYDQALWVRGERKNRRTRAQGA